MAVIASEARRSPRNDLHINKELSLRSYLRLFMKITSSSQVPPRNDTAFLISISFGSGATL